MKPMWRFEVSAEPGSVYLTAYVEKKDLEEFVKTKHPGHIVNDSNEEYWVLRYVVEEKAKFFNRIALVTITPTGI